MDLSQIKLVWHISEERVFQLTGPRLFDGYDVGPACSTSSGVES
jgi:hypothetical protein